MAGLPLANDLLDRDIYATSESQAKRVELAVTEYMKWRSQNPDAHVEEYFSQLYNAAGQPHFLWYPTVEAIGIALTVPQSRMSSQWTNIRYAARITKRLTNRWHATFWRTLLSESSSLVVATTNYDILVERTLRHRPMKRPPSPGVYYGGLAEPQILHNTASPFPRRRRDSRMSGRIPLFKLHGSLNWSVSTDGSVSIYEDCRPVFRKGGNAAIVPPVPRKRAPEWLLPVWNQASESLAASEVWLVCGYSMPQYDVQVHKLLQDAAMRGCVRRVILMNPAHSSLSAVIREALPRHVDIKGVNGIPKGLSDLSSALQRG